MFVGLGFRMKDVHTRREFGEKKVEAGARMDFEVDVEEFEGRH